MKWSFAAALGLHTALAAWLLIYWLPTQPLPSHAGNTIQAYIKIQAADIGVSQQKIPSQQAGLQQVAQQSSPMQLLQGQHQRLLILFHNLLQNSINKAPLQLPTYLHVTPVILCFTLNRSGTVTDLELKQSSNYDPLTQLSLQAAKQLTSTSIQQRVHQPTRYCVDINR